MLTSKTSLLPKKGRMSLSLKGKQKQPIHQRFGQADDGDLEAASRGVVPTNTSRNNRWALNIYSEWKKSRQSSSEPLPKGFLSSRDDQLLCKWLCHFAMETRQENGKPYPPRSIYLLLCGLYRVCKGNGVPFNFLDKADSRFRDLHNTLATVFSSLHAHGVGADKTSGPAISIEDEDPL